MSVTSGELAAFLALEEPSLHLRETRTEAHDGYVLERLVFEMSGVGSVRGLLTRPAASRRGPAILYAHSHGDRPEVGASELTDGRDYLLTAFGPVLARAGYVTLAIDMPTFGRRDGVGESAAAKALIWYGRSLVGQMLQEQMAALTYLATRDDVDPARIGGFGISMGATLTCWQAAVDPRLKVIAHLCCFADYATLVALGAHDNHGLYLSVPGLLARTSTGHIAGLVAPRPQLICVGEKDELTPPASIGPALEETQASYFAAGAEDSLIFFQQPRVGHRETREMRALVLSHFGRHL